MIPTLDAQMERAGAVRWLSRTQPILAGPSLGEMGLGYRGWKDDFLGDWLRDQYSGAVGGAGSGFQLVDGEHGGVERLTADTADTDHAGLILGNSVGAYDSLDADLGWVMHWKMRANQIANIQATGGVYGWNAAGPPYIMAGLRSDVSGNWIIRTTTDSVAFSNADSGIAADTDWHWHSLATYDVDGTTTVGYWVDGVHCAEYSGANLSGAAMTPTLLCVNRGGAGSARTADFDYWDVIPR